MRYVTLLSKADEVMRMKCFVSGKGSRVGAAQPGSLLCGSHLWVGTGRRFRPPDPHYCAELSLLMRAGLMNPAGVTGGKTGGHLPSTALLCFSHLRLSLQPTDDFCLPL